MRDIKFRGKSIDSGEWVYGDLLKELNKLSTGIPAIVNHDSEYIIPRTEKVNINTVGQYIGKKDINIVSIYDDDIIKYDIEFEIFDGDYNQYGLVGVIKYNEKTCSYEVFENDDNYSVSLLENIEVIGNIHDNPELIGGKNANN